MPLVHSRLHADLAGCQPVLAANNGCFEARVLLPRVAAQGYELLPPLGLLPCAVCQLHADLPALLQARGWAHPAYREAYVLAQLWVATELCNRCPAAAQDLRHSNGVSSSSGAAAAANQVTGAGSDGACLREPAAHNLGAAGGGVEDSLGANSTRATAAGAAALPACHEAARACSCSPAQRDEARACEHAATLAADCQRGHSKPVADCPGAPRALALEALRAVDMALILGAPPEAAAPVRMCFPAGCALLADRNTMAFSGKGSFERQVLAAAQALVQRFAGSPGACAPQPDTLLPNTPPARLPALDAARAIPRCASAELPRVRFRREFWKADAPVIITGAASLHKFFSFA